MPPGFDPSGTCRSCGEPKPQAELDHHYWCEECRGELHRRIRGRAHVVALLVVLPFAVWILVQGRFGYLPLYAWLLPLGAAYYLGFRIGREALKGWARWKRVSGPSGVPRERGRPHDDTTNRRFE